MFHHLFGHHLRLQRLDFRQRGGGIGLGQVCRDMGVGRQLQSIGQSHIGRGERGGRAIDLDFQAASNSPAERNFVNFIGVLHHR